MFLRFHVLKDLPFSNINRDQNGYPKTGLLNGVQRIRRSSQNAKRSIFTHPSFAEITGEQPLKLSQYQAIEIYNQMLNAGMDSKVAVQNARLIVGRFLTTKDEKSLTNIFGDKDKKHLTKEENECILKTMTFFDSVEHALIQKATEYAIEKKVKLTDKDDVMVAIKTHATNPEESKFQSLETVLRGRMIADLNAQSTDSCLQVGHGFTTHEAHDEEDFFVAIDDLTSSTGSGHLGSKFFSSGVFYQTYQIDLRGVKENLHGDKEKATRLIKAFTTALFKESPQSFRTSMHSNTSSLYMLVEYASTDRGYGTAFSKAVTLDYEDTNHTYFSKSIEQLEKARSNFNRVAADEAPVSEITVCTTDPDSNTLAEVMTFIEEVIAQDFV